MPFTADFWGLSCLSSPFLLLPPLWFRLVSCSQPHLSHQHWDPHSWFRLKLGPLWSKGWKHRCVSHLGKKPSSTLKSMVAPTPWMLHLCPSSLDTLFHRCLFTFSTSRYGGGGEIPGTGRIHTLLQGKQELESDVWACLPLQSVFITVPCLRWETRRWEQDEVYTDVSLFFLGFPGTMLSLFNLCRCSVAHASLTL